MLPTATVTGRAPNRPESAQANASPIRRVLQRARRVRRGGGGGAAAARRPPPGPAPRCATHWRSSACTDRGLRRTPTDPRHGLRVALRTIRCRCRTAAGRAGTYHIAAHSEKGAPHAALPTTWLATHCEFGFARTPPSVGRNGGAGPTADPGEGRGASPPALPGRARARRRYVGCGLSSHRTHACIGRIPLEFDNSALAASTDGA